MRKHLNKKPASAGFSVDILHALGYNINIQKEGENNIKNIKFDNNIKISIVLEGSKLSIYKDDDLLWSGEDWVKMKQLIQTEAMLVNKDKIRFRIIFSTKHGNVIENKFKLSVHFSDGYLYGGVDIDGWYNDVKIITTNTDYDTFDTILEKHFVDMVDFIGIATDKEEFKQNFATFFVKMYMNYTPLKNSTEFSEVGASNRR